MDSGAGRRSGVRIDEDPHGRKWVRNADQSTNTRQTGCMSETDQTSTTSHTGVKGEFFGEKVPPDGMCEEPDD